MNTKSKHSKDFSDPLTSIARRRGSDFSIDVSFNVFSLTKEDVGFEPTHAFIRLTVFKTVPFSRTWVILQNQSKSVFSLGSWTSQIPIQSVTFSFSTESVNRNEIVVGYAIASYSGQFLQHRHASLAGLGTSLFTLCYGFKVAH